MTVVNMEYISQAMLLILLLPITFLILYLWSRRKKRKGK